MFFSSHIYIVFQPSFSDLLYKKQLHQKDDVQHRLQRFVLSYAQENVNTLTLFLDPRGNCVPVFSKTRESKENIDNTEEGLAF